MRFMRSTGGAGESLALEVEGRDDGSVTEAELAAILDLDTKYLELVNVSHMKKSATPELTPARNDAKF